MSTNAEKAKFTAYVGHYPTFMNYFGMYDRALDALINHVRAHEATVDSLCFPILFNLRHCIELGLKANIRYFRPYSEVDNHVNSGSHHLVDLKNAFHTHITKAIEVMKTKYGITVEAADITEFNQHFAKLEAFTDLLHQLDQYSTAFRYPVDKDKQPSFNHGDTIDVLAVCDAYTEVKTILAYTAAFFEKYTQGVDDIHAYYKEMERSMYA
jgi:phage tail protein X